METRTTHLIMEFFGCECRLSDAGFIASALRQVAKEAKLTKLHVYSHRFRPAGVTAVVVLKESHLCIHTWPEHGYAAIDLFTCGSRTDALKACRLLMKTLKPHKVNRREIRRGIRH